MTLCCLAMQVNCSHRLSMFLFCFLFILTIPNYRAEIVDGVTSNLMQFCDFETFRARCSSRQEVILMDVASYGRRETGRCLKPESIVDAFKHDPRYYGCSADVLHIADRKCSGRTECDVNLPDVEFERVTPCYQDSRKYLEAQYTCIRVADADRSCTVHLSTSPLHISISAGQSDCGTKSQPWALRSPTGQRIRVHLLDFSASATLGPQTVVAGNEVPSSTITARELIEQQQCLQPYGMLIDTNSASSKRQVPICRTTPARDTVVYETGGNSVDVVLNRSNSTAVNFLLRFYAVGCHDVRPPPDAWFRRTASDVIEIGCYMSRQVWVLRCVNNQYVGAIGNCTQYLALAADEDDVKSEPVSEDRSESLAHALALVAVVGAGLAVCLTIICVGILCLRRRNDQHHREDNMNYQLMRNGDVSGCSAQHVDCTDTRQSTGQTARQLHLLDHVTSNDGSFAIRGSQTRRPAGKEVV